MIYHYLVSTVHSREGIYRFVCSSFTIATREDNICLISRDNVAKVAYNFQDSSCLIIENPPMDIAWRPRNLKGGIRSLLTSAPVLNATGRQPYWPSRTKVSYCTFGFGAIIQPNLSTLSLPRDNLYACVIKVHVRKVIRAFTKLLGRLSYDKIRRYNNSSPMWWQDGCHNRFPL